MPNSSLHATCCDLVGDVVRLSGGVRLKVNGTSMLPAILPGDVIHVFRSASADLLPGDVVLYKHNGALTAHRIIAISGSGLLTQGDSLPSRDAPVEFENVLGRVGGIYRNGRVTDCRFSFWQRSAALLFRRSELCTRWFLRLWSRLQTWGYVADALMFSAPSARMD